MNDTQPPSLVEAQLLGCMLHARTSAQLIAISRAVPSEALQDALHRAIYAACVDLARADRWDPSEVARRVHLNGWPRDTYGQVTGRIVDLLTGCAWPEQWQPAAAEVLEVHARSRLATILNRTEEALGSQSLTDMALTLTAAAGIAASCGELVAALTGDPGFDGQEAA